MSYEDGPAPEDETFDVSDIESEVRTSVVKRLADAPEPLVRTPMEAEACVSRMRDNATFLKEARERFRPAIEAAEAAVQKVRDLRESVLSPIEAENATLKRAYATYDAELIRQRAEEIERQAERAKAEPGKLVIVPPPVEKPPDGASMRNDTEVEVTNVLGVLGAIVSNHPQTSKDWVKFDIAKIKKMAQAHGSLFKVPGISVRPKRIVVVRSR